MNQPSVIDQYYEHFSSITAGTEYGEDIDADDEAASQERRIREVSYNLWRDAQGNKLADQMERKKRDHFEQLYEFSYGVSMYEEDYFLARKTETVAMLIIEEKESYERNIRKIRKQFCRFREICNQLSVGDRHMYVSYFEQSCKVSYEQLRSSIIRNLPLLDQYYSNDEEEWRREVMMDRINPDRTIDRIIPKPDIEKRTERKNKMRQLFAK